MVDLPNPTLPPGQRALFLIVIAYVDGSVHYEQADNKEQANDILAETISDPEVADWVAYQLIKAK